MTTGSAHHTIAKLGNCCIDPHFSCARKHFAFTLLWLEKFSSFDPYARISSDSQKPYLGDICRAPNRAIE